jgi:hypothetical protein
MLARLCLALLILSLCVSCRSTQRLVKAFPAEPSAFLQHGSELRKTDASISPFLMEWKNPDERTWASAEKRTAIHIAPVTINHLRPMTRTLSKVEVRERGRQKMAQKLASQLHEEVTKAFASMQTPERTIAEQPDKNSLVLELNIIELNPNPISGGLMRKGINILLWPGAETMVSHKLKGNMAIEGRLRDEASKTTLYEFTDAEQNRSGIILYYHDYTNYSYFRKAVREWAKQIAEVVRTKAKAPVKDGPPATFYLW